MKNRDRSRYVLVAVAIVLAALLGVAVVQLFHANHRMEQLMTYGGTNLKEYSRHYVLITNDPDSDATKRLLTGCQREGERGDAYVELFASDLASEYSQLELVNMAIEMQVDGIILEAAETEEYRMMIDAANAKDIPVVTVQNDCMDSSRISYVGIGAYDLGRAYGREIIRNASKDDHTVLILMDKDADDSNQNIIYNGIFETLQNEGNHLNMELEIVAVDESSYFVADESIRSLLTNTDVLPDFVVCLSERDTLIMTNAIVEYNIVGKIDVLGYYASEAILQSIDKQILTSTESIDYELMGEACVDALVEYTTTGNVNGYYLVDVYTVNATNLKEYMEREGN